MNKLNHLVVWDKALIEKYNYSAPRYTSYPTALEFNEEFAEASFLAESKRYLNKPLSLYVHIPFCHQLCYFCACNKIITHNDKKVKNYLAALKKEIKLRSALFKNRIVTQLHFGGGTPTFLTESQLFDLMQELKSSFKFDDHAELSIEIDPRTVEINRIDHLAALGFNRLSLGIQDFDPEIQRLINRVQSKDHIDLLFKQARQSNFESISVDLIYGLPKQTVDSFQKTLKKIIELAPDRISSFNYAHLPARFPAQRKIKDQDLPSPQEKLAILESTIETLTQAGYHFIGMDHFAKPEDELAIAQRDQILHRNFQGYTTQQDADLLGLGVSAISMIGECYAQNQKDIRLYESHIQEQDTALWKGFILSIDDQIRRDVIKQLICHFYLDKTIIEERYNIQFDAYFKEDLELLAPLIQDELVFITPTSIKVSAKGRLLIRNICVCFDVYMRKTARQQQFSRVI